MRLSFHGSEEDAKRSGPAAVARLVKVMGLDDDDVIKAIAGKRTKVRKVLVAKNKGFAHSVMKVLDEQFGDEYSRVVDGLRDKIAKRLGTDEDSDAGNAG